MTSSDNRPARVGLITDQTGALSFMGIANVNVAKMVIDDINARGGLLGRPVELFVEDSATDDAVAEAAAAKLVEQVGRRRRRRRHLQLDAPGHQGTGRRPGGDALPLPGAVRGPGVPPADLLHRPGAGAADRAVLPVADAARPGRRRFYMPSADYIWPHTLNKKVREVVSAEGGEIVGEEYFPLDHIDYERVVDDIMATRRRGRVQHDRPARAHAVPRAAAPRRLHRSGRARSCAPTSTRTS